MANLVFFYILQLPHTVISNSEKLTHPNVHTYIIHILDLLWRAEQAEQCPDSCESS